MSASFKDVDNGFKAAISALAKANIDVVIGVLGSAGESEVQIAAVHEFGSQDGHIPQRSYLRLTVDARRDEILNLLEKQLHATDPAIAANRVGLQVVSMVRETIRSRQTEGPKDQALRPATIKRKGSDLPLVDTGRLLQSITSEQRSHE